MSLDLMKRSGLQMLSLDRETHEIMTHHKLAIIYIDALDDSTSPCCCNTGAIRTRPGNGIRPAKSTLHQSVLAL